MHSLRPAATPDAPLVHKKSLIGVRAACEHMWGASGVQAIAESLPADVRERTAGLRPLPEWIPLGDLIAWHAAIWNGPANQDEKLMLDHARRTIDQGFGRVKRALISIATAHTLAPRVAALWNDEYTTGSLTVASLQPKSVTLVLRDHPYVEDPLMRMVIAEAFRHVLSLTRTKNVSSIHLVTQGSLKVVLSWS
ncbi:MAG TPA: hypothetical protein VJR89_27455 [Polyangiales bacterium]|nr:hypothetical protein [Polyangiales bacterium]